VHTISGAFDGGDSEYQSSDPLIDHIEADRSEGRLRQLAHFFRPCRPWRLRSFGEAGEIVKRTGDEPLPAWVLILGRGGEELEKIPRARYRFGTRRGRGSVGKILQFFLATSQRRLVSLNLLKIAADLGVSLSGHAAPPVENKPARPL
jgi:hypothetical protein